MSASGQLRSQALQQGSHLLTTACEVGQELVNADLAIASTHPLSAILVQALAGRRLAKLSARVASPAKGPCGRAGAGAQCTIAVEQAEGNTRCVVSW